MTMTNLGGPPRTGFVSPKALPPRSSSSNMVATPTPWKNTPQQRPAHAARRPPPPRVSVRAVAAKHRAPPPDPASYPGVGDEIEGTVVRVTTYGAFVDIGDGLVGLVHISEVANTFIKALKDHVAVGDRVKVRVLSVDHRQRRLSLSIKQSTTRRATGYERVVELGGDWGHPWGDPEEDGTTTPFLQLAEPPPPDPYPWQPDMSLFKKFDEHEDPPVDIPPDEHSPAGDEQ